MTLSWLNRLFRPHRSDQHIIHPPAPDTPLDTLRLVVADVETTGLNLRKDSVISIGAVAVVKGRLMLSESFDQTLRVPVQLKKENVLVHGITPTDVSEGQPPEQVMQAFLHYLNGAPLIAFHALFDKKMLEKALRTHLQEHCRLAAFDLAQWLPALFPEHRAARRMGLDDWTHALEIPMHQRHHAIEDAMATAHLLQKCLARAQQQAIQTWGQLMDRVNLSHRHLQAMHAF